MKKLQKLLNQVFTPSGEVKPCGREICIRLIEEASANYPETDFGNPETGFMNEDNFRKVFF